MKLKSSPIILLQGKGKGVKRKTLSTSPVHGRFVVAVLTPCWGT